jgi:hypothetical protein
MDVLQRESCLLTLNYAYYHVFFCFLQAAVLWFFNRSENFAHAHAFGLFAFVMDYGLNYMNTGTRNLSYPNVPENMDQGLGIGDEAMTPIGEFLFFLWFDYGAFGFLLWSATVESHLRTCFEKGLRPAFLNVVQRPIEVFSLIILPLQFWTAPVLSPYLSLDSRTLLLTRSSSKSTYILMLITFIFLLRYVAKLPWINRLLPILLSGFGCGLIHHAPLYTFNMRGYSDSTSLIITLCTEWPALISGIAVLQILGGELVTSCQSLLQKHNSKPDTHKPNGTRATNHLGTRIFTTSLWALFFSLMYPHLSSINDKDAIASLIPVIPGQHMQTIGTTYMRFRTCILPRTLPPVLYNALTGSDVLECFSSRDGSLTNTQAGNTGGDLLVMASAAKSGAVLSARIVTEVPIIIIIITNIHPLYDMLYTSVMCFIFFYISSVIVLFVLNIYSIYYNPYIYIDI